MDIPQRNESPTTMLPPIGIGLRRPHMAEVLARQPVIGFFEVHPENYVLDRSERAKLHKIREKYPLSLHSVGLSLGSARGVNDEHLSELVTLAHELLPIFVSDHLSWSIAGQAYLNDLLPLPYTHESLAVMTRNIERVQEALGHKILVENPSLYALFERADFAEVDFITELVKRTGCGLLLDVNNAYVSAFNLGFDAKAYIETFPMHAVEEFHLAGHAAKDGETGRLLIDDHGSRVSEPVRELYAFAKSRASNAATLIEWDSNVPPLDVLLAEARKAEAVTSASAPKEQQTLEEIQTKMAQLLLEESSVTGLELGLTGHLSVYRNNVQTSLIRALETAFPAVLRLVGEDYFRQTAHRFIRQHPPSTPYVAAYGTTFPAFLERVPGTETLPYLADTARLDWLASRVAMFDVDPSLEAAELATLAGQGMSDALVFETQDGLGYLSSNYPVDKIWSYARAGDESAPPPRLEEGPSYVEIFNDGVMIRLRVLDETAFVFREALSAGLSLERAASAAHRVDPLFDLSEALRDALRDGIFKSCRIPAREKEEA